MNISVCAYTSYIFARNGSLVYYYTSIITIIDTLKEKKRKYQNN